MNHASCDFCGKELRPDKELRYEMKVEIKAAYDPLQVGEEELTKDFRAEIAKVLEELSGISAEDAQDQIYREFEFDLCPACQRKVVRDPLAKHIRQLFDVGE